MMAGDPIAMWFLDHGIDPLNVLLALVAATSLTFLVHIAWPHPEDPK